MNTDIHLAVIGTGRVGRMTLLALAHEPWISRLTLVDTETGLANAVGEEIRHSLASTRVAMDVEAYEEDSAVEGADMVLITAGQPRTPEMETRAELIGANAEIIKQIAEETAPNNPGARYIVVTNPVDAMATYFKRLTGEDWVVSTGTNLESQRFRAEIAKQLSVPITDVSGFVGGEHGQNAVFLWSTVDIDGLPLEKYLSQSGKSLDREHLKDRVKEISRQIITYSGGTRHGPATSFRDILRSIAIDDNRYLALGVPREIEGIPESVMVSVPQMVGKNPGPTLEKFLTDKEIEGLNGAGAHIYETYKDSVEIMKSRS